MLLLLQGLGSPPALILQGFGGGGGAVATHPQYDVVFQGDGALGSPPIPVNAQVPIQFGIRRRDGNLCDVPTSPQIVLTLPDLSSATLTGDVGSAVATAQQIVSLEYKFAVRGLYTVKLLAPMPDGTPGAVAYVFCSD
jgi:hypothetical protein